ncbi:NADH-ubiquinone oxidoreductase [Helicobacter aurati]|uniref:NADH-ubiquinone oxidoreductase n=1 Tax=Helicobacter aurati TaxID=137778 RepID=A0A3D8J8J9_9HELI|nr:2Fe-2S iron-sulfur cluster-binding protein [Helicobacter aurati]RDU73181.1 NADH-ubiquinone oxidoreductase [Helicobacter aurati]
MKQYDKKFTDNHCSDFVIFIDGKQCVARSGQSILQIARENGIYIPTLCDLSKLSPTGACRMCIVEEENGNVIASCKSYPNPSLKPVRFRTNTEKLQKYRNQIMSFLCINHPLECGVCDKSGECELQDKVLESKVSIQPYFAIQKQQDFVHFHNKIYNEGLCIMCERCARTCNEFVGNNVLTVLSGGFHSKIGVDFNAYCEDCDECVSVCPTGAMFSQRFTYTSNAWELDKRDSICLHCSLRCELRYEVKCNIDSQQEVYRIKNDAHIKQLCHAGRHNFLRQNPFSDTFLHASAIDSYVAYPFIKNPLAKDFLLAEVLDRVEALRIGTNVTNEEAYLANMLATKAKKKLYCNEALRYSEFLQILTALSLEDSKDNSLIQDIRTNAHAQNVVIVLGSYLYDEMPVLRSDLAKNALKKGSKNVWISTIAEERFQSDLSLKYEVHTELGIAILLLHVFKEKLQRNIMLNQGTTDNRMCKIIESTREALAWLNELDLAYIIAETAISEYELERLQNLCNYEAPLEAQVHANEQQSQRNIYVASNMNCADIRILVGQDFYLCDDYRIIAKILSAIHHAIGENISLISYDNIHGIGAICDLDYDEGLFHSVLGIRCNAEFSIAPMPYAPYIVSQDSKEYCPSSNADNMDSSVDSSNTDLPSCCLSQESLQNYCPILPLQFLEGTYIDAHLNLVKLQPSFVDNGFGGISNAMPQGVGYQNPNLDLLDICREYLELSEEYLIEISQKLPFIKGKKEFCFDTLQSSLQCPSLMSQSYKDFTIAYPKEINFSESGGIFIYKAAMSGNFSFYRNEYYSKQFATNGDVVHGILKVSEQFCIASKLQDSEIITLQIGRQAIRVKVLLTSFLKGMVAVLASDVIVDSNKYFGFKRI